MLCIDGLQKYMDFYQLGTSDIGHNAFIDPLGPWQDWQLQRNSLLESIKKIVDQTITFRVEICMRFGNCMMGVAGLIDTEALSVSLIDDFTQVDRSRFGLPLPPNSLVQTCWYQHGTETQLKIALGVAWAWLLVYTGDTFHIQTSAVSQGLTPTMPFMMQPLC